MKSRNTIFVILIAGFLLFSFQPAFTHSIPHVVPTAYVSTPGTATFLGPLATAQRTYQLLINESELQPVMGNRIEGITWRLPVSATSDWPVSDISFTNYDIYLSGSVTPADRSLTFINNVVGVQRLVKSGSLSIPAVSFTFGGNPNSFGREITFDSAYLYTGGHLLIEIRHTGFTGTSRSVDAIGTAITGYGTLFSACWAGSYTGTSGSQGNFAVSSLTIGGMVGINDPSGIPNRFMLGQNYPNPFNPVTKIVYELPEKSIVNLSVYDIYGRELFTLVDETKNTGYHSIDFDASQFSSGTYFYKINANPVEGKSTSRFVMTRKMIVVK